MKQTYEFIQHPIQSLSLLKLSGTKTVWSDQAAIPSQNPSLLQATAFSGWPIAKSTGAVSCSNLIVLISHPPSVTIYVNLAAGPAEFLSRAGHRSDQFNHTPPALKSRSEPGSNERVPQKPLPHQKQQKGQELTTSRAQFPETGTNSGIPVALEPKGNPKTPHIPKRRNKQSPLASHHRPREPKPHTQR
jgi:hypothetical protein